MSNRSKVDNICLNVSYLAPEPSVHTVICMLGSGGIMGDTRLFGSKQYMLGNTPYFYTIKNLRGWRSKPLLDWLFQHDVDVHP